MKRFKTKYTGVYERKSDVKQFNGKPDVCFDIAYRQDGKLVWKKAGWLSEGLSAKTASLIRSEHVRSNRYGLELPGKKAKAPFFKDVAARYLQWAGENKTRNGSDDLNRYKNHLAHRFDDKRLSDIFPLDLERMKSELTKEGLAPATVKHCLVLVRQIFNKAVLWGLHQGNNPVKGVKMPAIQNQRERFLSYDEAKTLLGALNEKSQTLHDMATISLHCGLRAGEIFNLKGQHIDLENGIITITDPKNKTARKAFMTNAVKEILEKRITEKESYIFPDKRHGGKINEISKAFSLVVDSIGFNEGVEDPRQKVTFHTLRHTFASWLALQGESLMTIRELLGHKSFEMTKRYAHLMPDEKRKATMKLERAFNKKDAEIVAIRED